MQPKKPRLQQLKVEGQDDEEKSVKSSEGQRVRNKVTGWGDENQMKKSLRISAALLSHKR